MKVLLTGANGYIGKRLLPLLVGDGHYVYCCVRDKSRHLIPNSLNESVEIVEVDFLKKETLKNIPDDIDAAYFLIHSMSSGSKDFESLELETARNFRNRLENTQVKQVIYLGGIVNEETLSPHLLSRKKVGKILQKGNFATTELRAGIIVGSGSASFEIIRDLSEKLPIMVAPKWVETKCQPIAVKDVLQFLKGVLLKEKTYDQIYDIAGPDVLTYKEMLYQYAEVRQLNRRIITVPVMTPKLSSYWLYFVTSTSYSLAKHLVESMKIEVISKNEGLKEFLGIEPMSYKQAIEKAFTKIKQNVVASSWKDSAVSSKFKKSLNEYIKVPDFGCFKDERSVPINSREEALDKIWAIGGDTGWYQSDWLWKIRGYLDIMVGGVGLNRGRTNSDHIEAGDSLDFWRVILADKEKARLLLYAEMKLPGEAWLEFKISEDKLYQIATFRPKGLWGRLYWMAVYPFHGIIFDGMIKKIAK